MEPIYGFEEEFFFLSNFYPSPMEAEVAGVKGTFQTGEHLFQAYKTETSILKFSKEKWVQDFINAPTPGKAKYLGRKIPLDVKQWDAHAVTFMKKTIYTKFEQHSDLKKLLLDTGNATLIEANNWGDMKWGVDEITGEGSNILGELLMRLRNYYQTN